MYMYIYICIYICIYTCVYTYIYLSINIDRFIVNHRKNMRGTPPASARASDCRPRP